MKINPKKIFNTIVFVLFTLFLSLFIASNSGYYEYENSEKVKFTDEKIKQFEKDIKDGKNINIKKYLTSDNKKYDNKITKIGNNMSDFIDFSMMDILERSFKFFEKAIE